MGSVGMLLLLSPGTGSRVEAQVHSQEDNLMAWMWQGTVHPYQPTAGRQQQFRPGFITLKDSWFCRRHCTQLCGVPALGSKTALEEGPQSDQAGMKCSTKLKTPGTFQTTAAQPMQEGIPFLQNSLLRIINLKSPYTHRNLSRTHQAASIVHGEQEANGTLIISHLHYAHNQEQGGGFQ